MSRNESKPETIEEQLGLSHIIKFIKTSIEFPAHQQAFVLYFYTDHFLQRLYRLIDETIES